MLTEVRRSKGRSAFASHSGLPPTPRTLSDPPHDALCHFRTSGSTLDALWTLLIDFLPAERNAMFDWIPSHLETWAQTGEVPVVEHQIRYDDGAGYERYMGSWSRLAGEVFLDWLAPRPGLRWIDIGCGNGAFTELLVQRCAPAEVQGIDPSEAQLAFARARPAARGAAFHQGDAMALPFPQDRFDAAVMALVIFFVPDPARGVAEMVRVVCPRRHGHDLCVGYVGRRISAGTDPGGNARDGP